MSGAKIRIMVGKAWVEVDAGTPKDAIRAIAPYYEVFGQASCGLCGGTNLGVGYRTPSGNDYYYVTCLSCGAQLDLGQHKEGGTLFAKRKLPTGEYDTNHLGWYKWQDRKQSHSEEGF